MSSWEWKLEEMGIQAASLVAAIPSTLLKVHHDDPDQAKTERLIFTATTLEEDPPDSKVYHTKMLVELRSTSRDASEIDAIFAGIEQAFYIPGVTQSIAAKFAGGLWFNNEESEDNRSDSRDTRRRSREFSFHVGHV